MRRVLCLLALVVAASCVALGQARATSAGFIKNGGSSAPRCLRENLSIKEGETDAAMGGVRAVNFLITNTSSAPCTLKGYPRAELLDRRGRSMRRAVNSNDWMGDDNKSPQLVTIEAGQTAWFSIHYNSGGAGHMGKPCPTYPKLRITAPGAPRAFTLHSEISSCPRTEFKVSPVQSGTPQ